MPLDLSDETAEQAVIRLQRELAHVQAQSRVVHAMAQSWKARALNAEEQVRRLQRKLDRRREKLGATPALDRINPGAGAEVKPH